MRKIYIGIDAAKNKFDACVRDDKNVIHPSKGYAQNLDGVDKLLGLVGDTCEALRAVPVFGIESTGTYHLFLYEELRKRGYSVRVFNPIELNNYRKSSIRKRKTDTVDASMIAKALAFEPSKEPVKTPPKEILELREICRARGRLMEKARKCKVQAGRNLDILCRGYSKVFNDAFCPSSLKLIRLCCETGEFTLPSERRIITALKLPKNSKFGVEKANRLHQIYSNTSVPDYIVQPYTIELMFLLDQLGLLSEQLADIDETIKHRFLKLNSKITTIPGIGITTGATILSEIGCIEDFNTAETLVAFAGLDPAVSQSGESDKRGLHISKRGPPTLRVALYHAAFASLVTNPVCRPKLP